MTMDGENSDQSSAFNDSNGGNWLRCWDNEGRTGLNLELSSELDHLVEDKDIAARAVAFVVSSTRKGIVPLCADVASLFRSRRHLQTRLERLKLENRALRRAHTSTHTSVSTSPTPASPHSGSERCTCAHDSIATHTHCSPCCSRCSSQCSSLTSDSPRPEKTSSGSVRPQKSPRLAPRTSAFSALHTTHAAVHAAPQPHPPVTVVHRKPPVAAGGVRKNSLPEIVCEPDNNVQKVSPRVSAEVDSDTSPEGGSTTADLSPAVLRDRYREVVAENKLLSGKLTCAHNEIDELRAHLKRLEDRQPSSECSNTNVISPPTADCSTPSTDKQQGGVKPKVAFRKRSPAVSGAGGQHCANQPPPPSIEYLDACSCDHCYGVRRSGTTGRECSQPELWLGGSRLELGHQVALNDGQIGVVRYIGHVDNMSKPGTIYTGIELDSPVGRHNGCVSGKTYFTCDNDRGIFLPLEDLVNSVTSTQTSVQTEDTLPSTVLTSSTTSAVSGCSTSTTCQVTSSDMASSTVTTTCKPSAAGVLPKRLFRVLDHTSRYVAATNGCNLKLPKNAMHTQNQTV